MKMGWQALLGAAIIASMAITGAHGQAPPPAPPAVPDGVRYIVTYVEVMPSVQKDGATLVRQFRDAGRKETGNLRMEAGQRIGQPNHFVILEVWQDQAAFDGHAKGAAATQFHDKLKAIQNAPYDERTNFPLSVGPIPASLGRDAVFMVTHVDVIPPQRENGTNLVKQLAEDGRKDDGNLRFESVVQTNRQNHFTVIEAWRNRKAADAHSMTAKTRAFREQLAPAGGALYDEQIYKSLD